jgi:AGZA family xanthine/uracil permease-like MFS transporter
MFHIRQQGSTVTREVLGGLTTFMAMSYIIFVQVALLSGRDVGMDAGGVMMATCIAAAAATLLMRLWANYPIALAPGMGENFFFAFTLVPLAAACGSAVAGWKIALTMTAVAGLLFLALSFIHFRARVLNMIPDALKSGIAAGIGLLIAVVGFKYGNLAVKAAGGGLDSFPGGKENVAGWVTLIGLGVTLVLLSFRIRGAILIGILVATVVAWRFGKTHWGGVVAAPTGLGNTAGGLFGGFRGLWEALLHNPAHVLTLLLILLFMDLFDTVGTLVGVAGQAGLMKNGTLPRAERALASDAAGTVFGACLGTSTVTSYIESTTGVQAGARTGLASVVTAACLLAAMFFRPVVETVIGDFGPYTFPTIAPALIVVGAMMMRALREVDWEDATEYIPAFLTMLTMPLTFSISDGIAIGFVSYAVGKLFTGRWRQCHFAVYIVAVLFAVRYVVGVFWG